MEHEDGYCDECGCELITTWLTRDGRTLCGTCHTVDQLQNDARRGVGAGHGSS